MIASIPSTEKNSKTTILCFVFSFARDCVAFFCPYHSFSVTQPTVTPWKRPGTPHPPLFLTLLKTRHHAQKLRKEKRKVGNFWNPQHLSSSHYACFNSRKPAVVSCGLFKRPCIMGAGTGVSYPRTVSAKNRTGLPKRLLKTCVTAGKGTAAACVTDA